MLVLAGSSLVLALPDHKLALLLVTPHDTRHPINVVVYSGKFCLKVFERLGSEGIYLFFDHLNISQLEQLDL